MKKIATYSPIHVPNRGSDMSTLDQQIQLEYQMVQSGINRYNKQLDDLLEKELGSKTKHGRTIIKGIVSPVQDALESYINSSNKATNSSKAKRLLKGMSFDKVAYLSLICIIDNLASYCTLLKVARNVGIQVETQKRLDTWLTMDKEVANNMIKEASKKSDKGFDHKRHGLNHKINSDGLDIPNWPNEDRIHIGLKLIDIIIEHTGIVKLEKRINKRKTVWHVVPTEETNEWIEAYNDLNQTALPRYSPCIIPPKDWDGFWGGGYYSEHINNLPFVRIHA